MKHENEKAISASSNVSKTPEDQNHVHHQHESVDMNSETMATNDDAYGTIGEEKQMIGGCCVCSDDTGYSNNPLVYCDGPGCQVAVHQACYGIVQIPENSWFCRACEFKQQQFKANSTFEKIVRKLSKIFKIYCLKLFFSQ